MVLPVVSSGEGGGRGRMVLPVASSGEGREGEDGPTCGIYW